MEQKTIGGFIAALRKANGLTQKDLAEQLNVSDKTVSRWERDEGAPDLSLIPVIAELFSVSCDELLRGERRSPDTRTEEETTKKGEKQRRHLLNQALARLNTRSILCMGLGGAGLIAAMICNSGFLWANIGFFVGCAFYLAACVLQIISFNSTLFTVSNEDDEDPEIGRFRRTAVITTERCLIFNWALLCFSAPLVLLVDKAHVGLDFGNWLLVGAILCVIGLLIAWVVCHMVNSRLIRQGFFYLTEKQAARFSFNQRLQRRCALILVVLLVITAGGQFAFHVFVDARTFAPKKQFDDYESFVAYMETPAESTSTYGWTTVAPAPSDSVVYYDEFGNEISEDEALRHDLTLSDGTVVCTYMDRNHNVRTVSYQERDGSLLPITVITTEGYYAGQRTLDLINYFLFALYFAELAAVGFAYLLKRQKAC